jgi:competence protein ComEC
MKKLGSFLLAFILVFSLFTPVTNAASKFPDVDKYIEEIEYLANLGIISGNTDGTFAPEESIQRVHAVQMILREKEIANFNAPNPNFVDIQPGDYGYEEVAKAVELGFIDGTVDAKTGKKYFKPTGTLTRAEMARILVDAYDLEGSYHDNFTDVSSKHWASPYVSTLAANNITVGYPNGTFKPSVAISREHFAAFMARQLNDEFKPVSELLKVNFINVGQGDSTLLITPNNKTILVDGGKRSAGDTVLNYLNKKGITSLDLVVATHPDADHIGGLIDVLEQVEVKKVLDSGQSHTSQTYLDYLSLIDEKNIPFQVAEAGEYINVDSAIEIQVLNSGEGYSDNNESSVVLKVSHEEIDYLLTGDAGIEAEENMIADYDLDAEVLKVGHHGSNTSTSQEFVEAVNPAYGILSYGEGNSYGHPHSEIYNRLVNYGVDLISTVDGTIEMSDDGDYIYIGQEQTSPNPNPEPEPTPEPTENVYISDVDLKNEAVTVMNDSNQNVDISGWYLISEEGNQRYDFPEGSVIQAGYYIKVLSGADAYNGVYEQLWTNAYIWNNSGDAALLYNSQGELVSEVR